MAEPGRAGRKSPHSLVLFLRCDRVFAEGSHRVFWNCGEIQAEISSDSSLASRTAKGQGWNGGCFPAGVISRRTKKEQTKFDLWMVRAGQPGMITWRSFPAGSPPRQGACHGRS